MSISKFEFSDNRMRLDVAGHIFEVDIENSKMQEDVRNILVKSQELEDSTDIAGIMQLAVEAIDFFLGDGATVKVFGSRKINFADLVDLLCFLQQEIIKFRTAKRGRYAAQYFNQ